MKAKMAHAQELAPHVVGMAWNEARDKIVQLRSGDYDPHNLEKLTDWTVAAAKVIEEFQPDYSSDAAAKLAEHYFPKQWAAIAYQSGKGKARHHLKSRARIMKTLEKFRSEGKRCGNCSSFQPSRIVKDGVAEMCCARDSFGWDGDLIVGKDNLCTKWEPERKTA